VVQKHSFGNLSVTIIVIHIQNWWRQ